MVDNINGNSWNVGLSRHFLTFMAEPVAKVTPHHPSCQSRQQTQWDGSTRCCVVHKFLLLPAFLASTPSCCGHLAPVISQRLPRDCRGPGTMVASLWQEPQPFLTCKTVKAMLGFVSARRRNVVASDSEPKRLFVATEQNGSCCSVSLLTLLPALM